MRLSRASTYALYGVCYLASQSPDRLVPLSEIRKHRNLPEKHLAKIFHQLVRSGHLRSVRGVKGGFMLARPAATISALDIIQIIDGVQRHGECPIHPKAPVDSDCCPIQQLVHRGRLEMVRVFKAALLEQLAEKALHLDPP